MAKIITYLLFCLALVLRISYYYSALSDYAIPGLFFTSTKGQDFFQIPNGAYSFWHGGGFVGAANSNSPRYMDCCYVNDNVYHPFFTLLIGTPLILFPPWIAYTVWVAVHAIVDVAVIVFLLRFFRNKRFFLPALILYLANPYMFYEIYVNQYHFLLTLAVILFLFEISTKGDSWRAGVYFFLGLLVKPIGLLWLVALIFKKKWRTAFIGVSLFALATLPFFLTGQAEYYTHNIMEHVRTDQINWDIFRLLHYFSVGVPNPLIIKALVFTALSLLAIGPSYSLFAVVTSLILFQVMFYDFTFPYHHSILLPVLILGILLKRIPVNKLLILALILMAVPTPFFIYLLVGQPAHFSHFLFVLWAISAELLLLSGLILPPLIKFIDSGGILTMWARKADAKTNIKTT